MSKGKENWWEKKEATNFEMFVVTFGMFVLIVVGIILGSSIISLQAQLVGCQDTQDRCFDNWYRDEQRADGAEDLLKEQGICYNSVWDELYKVYDFEVISCKSKEEQNIYKECEFLVEEDCIGLLSCVAGSCYQYCGDGRKFEVENDYTRSYKKQSIQKCVCSFGERCDGCKIINGKEYCYQEICDYVKCQDLNRRICNVNGNTSLCTPDWCDENLGKCEPQLYPEGQQPINPCVGGD